MDGFPLNVSEALQFLIVFMLGGGPPSSEWPALCLCHDDFLQLSPTPHANQTGWYTGFSERWEAVIVSV